MTHLLDTSALLAHYLDEPGAQEVEALLASGPGGVALAAPTWVELQSRLRTFVPDAHERERVFDLYTRQLCAFLPIDRAACSAAIRLRDAAPQRLPLVDALIAGTAHAAGLVLVHRDPHLDSIPGLKTVRLPDKTG
ncbi:hypothetical protein BH23VER1_BH23VER1_08300 [soil metagenome]